MGVVEGAGVELTYTEQGTGPPVLLIHGRGSSAAAWAGVADELAAAGARAIAYDRRGYGDSGAPEPYTATTVQEQAEDAAALLGRLGTAPALLLGEGFGALVALDLLVRRPELASGAALVDPPALALVPAATEALAAERVLLEEALRDGGPAHAVEAWLGGRLEGEALARAKADHRGFFADWGGAATWAGTRRDLRGIGVPVAIVTGPETAAHVAAAADAVAGLVPGARRRHDGDVVAVTRDLL